MKTRDILAIPVTTVAFESAFSIGGRVLSGHHSRLTPQMVEALMCSQSWLRHSLKGNKNGHFYVSYILKPVIYRLQLLTLKNTLL